MTTDLARAPALLEWPVIYDRLVRDREDADAWAALERRVRGWARRSIGGYGGASIDDVVADTCASVGLRLNAAHGRDSFGAFAHGYYLNARRALVQSRRGVVESLDGVDVAEPETEIEQDRGAELATLRDCLATLPPRDRRAVEMRYIGEADSRAIAGELGVSEGNARKIVFNGVARLRQCMAGKLQLRDKG
jgi:RNA polymerase sigma factor (sigma-70 family)